MARLPALRSLRRLSVKECPTTDMDLETLRALRARGVVASGFDELERTAALKAILLQGD